MGGGSSVGGLGGVQCCLSSGRRVRTAVHTHGPQTAAAAATRSLFAMYIAIINLVSLGGKLHEVGRAVPDRLLGELLEHLVEPRRHHDLYWGVGEQCMGVIESGTVR